MEPRPLRQSELLAFISDCQLSYRRNVEAYTGTYSDHYGRKRAMGREAWDAQSGWP